jgi:hypothetical protein
MRHQVILPEPLCIALNPLGIHPSFDAFPDFEAKQESVVVVATQWLKGGVSPDRIGHSAFVVYLHNIFLATQ